MEEVKTITKRQLVKDLRELGLSQGQTVMLHASIKSIGPQIEGGPKTVLDALFEILTESGTVMMLVGWKDNPYNLFAADFQDDIDQWPEDKCRKFYESSPAFDPEHSLADVGIMGAMTEHFRSYPGSIRSRHPLGYAAVGKLAQYVLKDQQWNYREGKGSPLEKLCELGGKVLLLGSSTANVTLLHFAENLADVPNKIIVRYKMPIILDGKRTWKEFEEYRFTNGIVPWPDDYFKTIVDSYLEKGNGKRGKVGMARSYLFDANDLNSFSVNWMEGNFCNLQETDQ